MKSKKPLEWDAIGGSELRDTQGEMLSVEGADISELEAGRGRLNDNHGKGFFNSIGKITAAKKIFSLEDCTDPRHEYYWNKIKAPYIYIRGEMYDSDHPNAKAAAAILRNIHKSDNPLKMKCSVEGGVIARGVADPTRLARTKIHSLAATFTPANQATLMEPLNLEKNNSNWEEDQVLIKSVIHLAKTDIPSFRHITRRVSAEKLMENLSKIQDLAASVGIEIQMPYKDVDDVVTNSIRYKLRKNIEEINSIISGANQVPNRNKYEDFKTLFESYVKLKKALTAGYAGGGIPTDATGGSVIQSESLDPGFKYITCKECGDEQVYMANQVRCRKCKKSFSFEDLAQMVV